MSAQAIIHPKIEALIAGQMPPDQPGGAVLVIAEGSVIHASGYGLANVEWQIPNTSATVFKLASLTKLFTAAGVMLLAEQGKLRLQDRIDQHLPEFHTAGHEVTLHHLLTHTAGLHDYTDSDALMMQREVSPAELLAQIASVPFRFKPGTRYQYNNSGYVLLGLLLERISGMSYDDWMRSAIFQPLGMTGARLLLDAPIIAQRAAGYVKIDGGKFINAPFLSMTQPYAAGGLGMSLIDWIRWDQAFWGDRLLSAASREAMLAPVTLADGTVSTYGYGIERGDYQDYTCYYHGGGIHGFSTFMVRLPEPRLSIIVLLNHERGADALRLATEIIRQQLELPPIKPRPMVLMGEALERCAGAYGTSERRLEFVVQSDSQIYIRAGARALRLMPFAMGSFFSVDFPEHQFVFSDERDGKYQQLTISAPLLPPLTHRRIIEQG